MRVLARCSTAALLLAAGAACASGGGGGGGGDSAPGERIPASSATVKAVVEMRPGPPPHQAVFVENKSTEPIVVSNAFMTECVNLGYLCDKPGGYQRIVRVRPGQREQILTANSATNPEGRFGYRVMWSWRPDVGDLTAAIEPTTEEITITSDAGRTVARATTGGAVMATDPFPVAASEALRRNVGRVRVSPDSVDMRVGQTLSLFDTFQVTLVDASGTSLGTVPFGFRIPTEHLTFRQPNFTATAAGRAVVEFTVPARLLPSGATAPQPAQVVFNIRP